MATKVAPSVLFIVSLGFVICSGRRALFTHEDRHVLVGDGAVVHRALHSGGGGHQADYDIGRFYATYSAQGVPLNPDDEGAPLGSEEADAAGYVGGPSGRGVDHGRVNRIGKGGSGGSPSGGPGVGGVGQRSGEGGGANGGGYGGGSGGRKGGKHGGYAP